MQPLGRLESGSQWSRILIIIKDYEIIERKNHVD